MQVPSDCGTVPSGQVMPIGLSASIIVDVLEDMPPMLWELFIDPIIPVDIEPEFHCDITAESIIALRLSGDILT